jgi:TRAP-type C4-dicarboxylate transport system substrate-binding protein
MVYFNGWGELFAQEFGKWNIHWVASGGFSPGNNIVSRVPLPNIDAVKGVKFRSAGSLALILDELGAETVWFPLEEIYTSLASGLIDGASGLPMTGMYGAGLAEVTKYWVMPCMYRVDQVDILANMNFWNSLSEADQKLIFYSAHAGIAHGSLDNYTLAMEALAGAKEKGIVVQWWDDESLKKYEQTALKVLPIPEDEASQQAYDALMDYIRSVGYMD